MLGVGEKNKNKQIKEIIQLINGINVHSLWMFLFILIC